MLFFTSTILTIPLPMIPINDVCVGGVGGVKPHRPKHCGILGVGGLVVVRTVSVATYHLSTCSRSLSTYSRCFAAQQTMLKPRSYSYNCLLWQLLGNYKFCINCNISGWYWDIQGIYVGQGLGNNPLTCTETGLSLGSPPPGLHVSTTATLIAVTPYQAQNYHFLLRHKPNIAEPIHPQYIFVTLALQ